MATITISNTGGNWNATGTWVGGVLPVAADTVVATATSGPVNVTVAAVISILDLSLYTNTLTLTSSLTVGGTLSGVNILTLSASMTIVSPTSAGILFINGGANTNNNIRSNGCVIPYFAHAVVVSNRTATLLDNFTITNYIQYLGNSTRTYNGFQLNITNWLQNPAGGGGSGIIVGTTKIYFNGANCTFDGISGQTAQQPIGNPIYIDTPGNFTITGGITAVPYTATNGIYYLQGTVLGTKVLKIYGPSNITGVNGTYEMDLNGAGTWTTITVDNSGQTGRTTTLRLLSDLNFTDFYLFANTLTSNYTNAGLASRSPILFTGSGALKGGGIYAGSVSFFSSPLNTQIGYGARVRLTPGPIHEVSYIGFEGARTGALSKCLFDSATGGVQATLNLTGQQAVIYTDFTDINSSGGNTIYTFNGTITNSSNILSTTTLVPARSATFVN